MHRPTSLLALFPAALFAFSTSCSSPTSSGSGGGGTISVGAIHIAGCSNTASPLPGWKNCTATAALTITEAISSGYVSVYMNYPTSGSFYHGQAQVVSGTTSYTVTMMNDYVPV